MSERRNLHFNLFECKRLMLQCHLQTGLNDSNADVVYYSATCRTVLNERKFFRQIVDRSYKLTKNHILS